MSVIYDGNWNAESQHGALVPFVDPITRATMWRQTLQWKFSKWKKIKLGAKGPGAAKDAFFVEEGDPRDLSGGIMEFERLFSEVPDSRVEWEDISHSYQYMTNTGSAFELLEMTLTTSAQIVYDYFHTEKPDRIPRTRAFRITNIGQRMAYVGSQKLKLKDFVFVPGTDYKIPTIAARDSEVTRWRGNIWQRRNTFVDGAALRAVLTSTLE